MKFDFRQCNAHSKLSFPSDFGVVCDNRCLLFLRTLSLVCDAPSAAPIMVRLQASCTLVHMHCDSCKWGLLVVYGHFERLLQLAFKHGWLRVICLSLTTLIFFSISKG